MAMAQRGKRSREGVYNIDETIDEVSGEKSSPPLSRGKKSRYTNIRLPARIAPLFFELTKTLGHKRDGKTVEWLIRESERDQDPHKFASADDLLINGPKDESIKTPPRKRREQRRQDVPRDRHRRTEDGRDRRVRVPYNCVSRLTDITQKLAGKSDGTTLEWLYKKYWLSGIRPQQAIPSTTTVNSTPVSTHTNFNGAYLVPDVDNSVFARAFSIAGHDHQQNPAGHYEQEGFCGAEEGGVSNVDQVSGKESSPLSGVKKSRYTNIRLPARVAPLFFELTKTLGFKRDGMTVEWLIQQSESDQDPHKFTSADDLLINGPEDKSMMTPPRKRREQGRQDVPKDRHRRTEDGRDRRVRVPYNCISRLTDLTQKLARESDGKTLEWLYRKYWLSGLRPQQAIPSTTTLNSPSASADTDFNGCSIFAKRFSFSSHNHQQNPAGHNEQEVYVEPTFNVNPNSVQYEIAPSSHPYVLYFGGSTNQLQYTLYPQQQTVIQTNLINTPSWRRNGNK
jgi:hypothetical protein